MFNKPNQLNAKNRLLNRTVFFCLNKNPGAIKLQEIAIKTDFLIQIPFAYSSVTIGNKYWVKTSIKKSWSAFRPAVQHIYRT